MNFFAQQERARAHTKRMLVLFVLAVACIVAALDFVLFLAFGSSGHGVHPGFGAVMFWNSVLVIGIIGACSMYKITALRGGGGVVARQAYNDGVMYYNNKREVFPSSIIANMFNFAPATSWEVESPEAKKAVKVSFS